jgi:hypothetical protein
MPRRFRPYLLFAVLSLLICSVLVLLESFEDGELYLLAEASAQASAGDQQQAAEDASEKTEQLTEIALAELALGTSEYPKSGIHAGVHNDGQAALWDLDIIDFYRIFGAPERAKGYRPEQPIAFSHVTHIQKLGIECQYCHWSVDKSTYATIPEVETCMGCHRYIDHNPENSAEVIEYQKQEIGKVREYYTAGKPIPWEKVHVIPNHVKFNHKRHVAAGVTCQSCHGQIPEMPVVERVSSMKMGWCIDCHRMQGASIDCTTCHY